MQSVADIFVAEICGRKLTLPILTDAFILYLHLFYQSLTSLLVWNTHAFNGYGSDVLVVIRQSKVLEKES